MDILTFKTVSLAILILILVSHSSCNNSDSDDSTNIDSGFLIKTNESIKNRQTLANINQRITAFRFDETLESSNKKSTLSFTNEDVKIVSLKSEVGKLFDPENHPCSLPEKIAKKLKKTNADGKPWAPKFVAAHIAEMPDSVIYIPRQSISNLLHWISVKKQGSNAEIKKLVTASPTYDNLNVEDYVLSGFNSFFYSLDCSGYLNAAIEGSGAVPGADIKSVAKSALETQNSMFIGGGVILSPLNAAYYGKKVTINTPTRLNILNALIATINEIANISDNDIVILNPAYDAVWASKIGASSFNGKADLKTSGGVGIGIAQISASASGGGSISRKSSFSNFNTYITKEHP
ncbi:MAG: hypothetical protein J0I84_02605, partial [Terrimonas sp.]|nr:hypothetical protein [Terrimonas sp.]